MPWVRAPENEKSRNTVIQMPGALRWRWDNGDATVNKLPRIRIMISSRAESRVFSGEVRVRLTDLRKRLQKSLHSVRWSNAQARNIDAISSSQQLFEVWIHENDQGNSSERNTFEMSLDEIRKADIVVVLYNGEAGWKLDEKGIGICHAEFQEAISRRGNVVYLIELEPLPKHKSESDEKFRSAVEQAKTPKQFVNNEVELQQAVLELLHKAVAELVRQGASGGRSRDRGLALDWSRLDMIRRRDEIRRSLAIELSAGEAEAPDEGPRKIELAGSNLAVCLHAVPGAMGIAAAREMLGQPFLRDHVWADELSKQTPGIVHVVACYKGVTENQASKIIGTPDTMTVASDFGVYAADHVQQIQMIFLANCADPVALAVVVRRLHGWLQQTREIEHVIERAEGRRIILNAIRKVLN